MGSEDERRKRKRPVEVLESLFRRKVWKTKLEGKSMLRQREQGTSEPLE